jgi:hypothetical protein
MSSEISRMRCSRIHFGVLTFTVLSLPSCRHSTEPPLLLPDTTSHAVIWKTDTLGVASYSTVLDVAIYDENDIWAVGEFYLRDSLGAVDPVMYNAFRWDGSKWNPLRLTFTYQGTTYLRLGNAVLAFGHNDVWIACNAPRHWDGTSLNSVNIGTSQVGEVQRLWGTSSRDLYCVGIPGRLSHFDGQVFSDIPTGVSSWFNDIYGLGQDVYVGSYYYDTQIRPSGVFSYSKGNFQFLYPDASDSSEFQNLRDALGVWVSPQRKLWAVGENGVFTPQTSHTPVYRNDYFVTCIRGTSNNDVWVGGDGGGIIHFNGSTWKKYSTLETQTAGFRTRYYSIAVKGSIVVAGGWCASLGFGVVTMGRRIN